MRPYLLAETNWQHLQNERYELAILPWGATEAHNFHLPYATDVIEADAIAAEAARIAWEEGGRVVVLPTIPFGVNSGQLDVYLDMHLSPTTQLAILRDVAGTLQRHKVPKFLILNSHGGNNFKPLVRELGVDFPDLFICFADWFRSINKEQFFTHQGDHADEMETSLLLHLRPDLVLPHDQWGDGAHKKWKIKGLTEGWAWAERRWSQISADTGTGDPREATAEKGATFFNAVTEKLASLLLEICHADVDDLYA